MDSMITEKIKLWGIVQGVGFRPFVAKCADKYGMKGEVLNIGGLVDIVVTDTKDRIDTFVAAIRAEKPVPAEIVHIKREEIAFREFSTFTILDSDEGDDEAAMIPADLSMCPDCLAELADPSNPRYQHPFISCMACGPRYTIIDRIPYDRENTAMIDFPMCSFCEGEYTDRNDRRYHAQTISCHDCGPQLMVRRNGAGDRNCDKSVCSGEFAGNDEMLSYIVELLRAGRVVAMKGVGGYNLLADPLSSHAVQDLREIKGREQKPFAVMFKDMDEVKKFCYVSSEEENLLKSSAKPIILLEHKSIDEISRAVNADRDWETDEALYPDFSDIEKSRFVGTFLPSMGAQDMLLERFGGPLIITSANPSDMPMIKDDAQMFGFMDKNPLIAACLYNERDIRVRVDDSVARVIDGQPQMIRRSKGYAPVPLFISPSGEAADKSVMIFATGGQLKNSFVLSKGHFSYVSQYFGDLDCTENRELYEENVERMTELFRIKPTAVVCDMHPLYYTTAFAEKYAEAHGLPVLRVQHHHAHVASVMAEHHIEDTVIGVSMDGTGYGTDGKIWGGEFLVCNGGEFERAAHIKYVSMIGGDGSMKEAWKSAMCYAIDNEKVQENDAQSKAVAQSDSDAYGASDVARYEMSANGSTEISLNLDDIFEYAERNRTISDRKEWPLVRAALKAGINGIESSSMGRLFDAVSALLGIKDYNDYEGQCAIALEDAAARAAAHPRSSERDDLALVFHERVAQMIADTCRRIRAESENTQGKFESDKNAACGINKVALTGGVFQNKILTERTLELLRANGFETYYNVSVSPNDSGIALGQNYIALCRLKNSKY